MTLRRPILQEQKIISMAARLIGLGARGPVVEALTQLGHEKTRRLYREITGGSPARGQLPSMPKWYLRASNSAHSGYFFHVFREIMQRGGKSASTPEALIAAYNLYRSQIWPKSAESLSFDRAWWLVRLMQIDSLKQIACSICGAPSVVESSEIHDKHVCYFCKLKQRRLGLKTPRKKHIIFSQLYPKSKQVLVSKA